MELATVFLKDPFCVSQKEHTIVQLSYHNLSLALLHIVTSGMVKLVTETSSFLLVGHYCDLWLLGPCLCDGVLVAFKWGTQ